MNKSIIGKNDFMTVLYTTYKTKTKRFNSATFNFESFNKTFNVYLDNIVHDLIHGYKVNFLGNKAELVRLRKDPNDFIYLYNSVYQDDFYNYFIMIEMTTNKFEFGISFTTAVKKKLINNIKKGLELKTITNDEFRKHTERNRYICGQNRINRIKGVPHLY